MAIRRRATRLCASLPLDKISGRGFLCDAVYDLRDLLDDFMRRGHVLRDAERRNREIHRILGRGSAPRGNGPLALDSSLAVSGAGHPTGVGAHPPLLQEEGQTAASEHPPRTHIIRRAVNCGLGGFRRIQLSRREKRPILRHLFWGLMLLLAVGLMTSGIGPIELIGDGLLALCLIKVGLKIHGHVIGGGPRRRLRFGARAGTEPAPPKSERSPGA